MTDEKIEVTAYSGSRDNEAPRAFILYGERIEVSEIVDRWIEEDFRGTTRKRCFRIRGSDGYMYKLCYDEGRKTWFLAKNG